MPKQLSTNHRCLRRAPIIIALVLTMVKSLIAAPSDWNVSVWQPNNALPNSKITGVVQTSDGYLWVGSFTGLARFDGVKFEQCAEHIDAERDRQSWRNDARARWFTCGGIRIGMARSIEFRQCSESSLPVSAVSARESR